MTYSAYAVANAFVQEALDGLLPDLTPMKLQKLLYFTQAWHIKGRMQPLLDDAFARWRHGPVVPAVHHKFRTFAATGITSFATTLSAAGPGSVCIPSIPSSDQDAWSLVDAIIKRYGAFSGPELSCMTQAAGSAWAMQVPDGSPITAEEILADSTLG